MSEKLLLSVNESGAALGVSRSSIYKMLGSGELSSVTLGRRRLIPKTAIEALIATAERRDD